MSDKRVKVPEDAERFVVADLAAPAQGVALLGARKLAQWITEHPIVPTDEQIKHLYEDYVKNRTLNQSYSSFAIEQFQRRFMFTEPEPEPDAELRSFLSVEIGVNWQDPHCAHMVEIATKAFRRGQQSMITKEKQP